MKDRPVAIGTEAAWRRLMFQVTLEGRTRPGPPPTPQQVAMVLHALADHTALEHARVWDRRADRLGSTIEDSPWPTTTSIGRWLHAVGDDIDDFARSPDAPVTGS